MNDLQVAIDLVEEKLGSSVATHARMLLLGHVPVIVITYMTGGVMWAGTDIEEAHETVCRLRRQEVPHVVSVRTPRGLLLQENAWRPPVRQYQNALIQGQAADEMRRVRPFRLNMDPESVIEAVPTGEEAASPSGFILRNMMRESEFVRLREERTTYIRILGELRELLNRMAHTGIIRHVMRRVYFPHEPPVDVRARKEEIQLDQESGRYYVERPAFYRNRFSDITIER